MFTPNFNMRVVCQTQKCFAIGFITCFCHWFFAFLPRAKLSRFHDLLAACFGLDVDHFFASSDRMSFSHSSRIIAPILHWLFPQMTEATVHAVVFPVRKLAHVTDTPFLS